MENFKRSVKRLITRLTILGLVVICGAIAIAQAQKDRTIANAAAPNLLEPATTINDSASSSPARQTNAVVVPDDATNLAWNQPIDQPIDQPVEQPIATAIQTDAGAAQREPQFLEDNSVRAVQAEVAQPANRFDNSFRDSIDSVAVGNAPMVDDGNRFGAPGLLQEQQPAEAEMEAPSPPPADTSLAPFPEASPPAEFNQPPPRFSPPDDAAEVSAPSALPADDRMGFASDRFDSRSAPGNPVRRSAPTAARGLTQEPAPLATAPPAFDSPPAYQPARQTENSFAPPEAELIDAAPLPRADFAETENRVSISGAGKPGGPELEGVQAPSISIQKIAPTAVRVGEPATFQIKIRNNGQIPAEDLLVRDEVPLGTELVDTNPQATSDSQGGILWEVGTLRPGEDLTMTMQVTPLREGAIGSVASVTFTALASAQAEAKQPMLKIEHSAKDTALIGDTVKFTINVENPGSGPATNVVIEEDVPQGLAHAKGPKLEYEIGTIPAGGRRRLELSLKAAEAGMVENVIVARAAGGLIAEHRLKLQVTAPQLRVRIDGPSRRYLERKATYTVAIENGGTAAARNVELVCRLPQGLQFVSTNNSGRYDASTNTIHWSLDRLPARQFGEVKFTATPVQKGEFSINAAATAEKGLSDSKDHGLVVEGLAALLFEVADQVDPIEVGGVTTYQIRVENQGTEVANNVRFVAIVPPGMRAVGAQGPTKYQIQGNQILFDSIPQLPAKGESTYNVRVEGMSAGDQRFTVQMTSDDTTSPVVEEESTRVYAD